MQTPEFATHIDALVLAAATVPTAIMCAEAYLACHRALLADALLVRGLEVRHILGPGRVETHALTPDARVLDGRLSYPASRNCSRPAEATRRSGPAIARAQIQVLKK